jgi:predicted ATPase/DNA-binding SARP family transcriptional activator
MARLTVRLLGPFEARLEGVPVTGFASNKVRALLAYLAVEAHRSHLRQVLTGLLWPDRPERAARASLRSALSNLRRVIGDRDAHPPFLHIARGAVQFNRDSDCWLDVAAFTALAETDRSTTSAISRLAESVDLYRGPFFEGFYLKDSAAFDDWCLVTRERLQRAALAALRRLAADCERRHDYELGCDYARRQVALEPWQEEAHRQLIRLLALSGQRSAALAQFEACRHTLAQELAVEPATETRALFERIRDGTELPSLPCARVHNLPAPIVPFVGRQTELSEIISLMLDPACRVMTLVGPGGSGKTRLAVETARELLTEDPPEHFRDGAYFVSLGPLRTTEDIVPATARSIGLPFHPHGTPRGQLLDYLREKDLLLILDNFEHLLDGAGLVGEIVRMAPHTKVLITSRTRLRMAGEHVYPVAGLSYPGWTSDDETAGPRGPNSGPWRSHDASQADAVALFVSSARRVHRGFELNDEGADDVVRICRLVDGMPLGILLAAAWARLLTPGEIAAQLGESLDFLAADVRDLPERQRSMRAVFDHSWILLSDDERHVMRALSVFRGTFTRDAAQEVTGASPRTLLALLETSLLDRSATARYEVHELLRQYAAEKLGSVPGASETVRDRHSAYYATALHEWGQELRGARQQAALEEIDTDVRNVVAAWDWAVERTDVERLRQASEGLCLFYERRGRYQEGESACRSATETLAAAMAECADTMSANRPPRAAGFSLLARMLGWQSQFSLGLGHLDEARDLAHRGLNVLEQPQLTSHDTRQERAFLLRQMGEIAAAHDTRESQGLLRQSLELYEALADKWGTANTLVHLGRQAQTLSDCGEARRLNERSLAIRQSLGDRLGIAESLTELRVAAEHAGQLEESERLARECLVVSRDLGSQWHIAQALHHLGSALMVRGRFADARPMLEEAVAISHGLGTRAFHAYALEILAWCKCSLGLYAQARAHEATALAAFREMDVSAGIALSLLGVGGAVLAQGNYAEALHALCDSIALFHETGQLEEEGLAHAQAAHAATALGLPARARYHLQSALRAGTRSGTWSPRVVALPGVAVLLASEGEAERAVELYALAARYPYVGNSRFWEDIAGPQMHAAAASLTPHALKAAQERGRARDLDATAAELLEEFGP